MDSTLKRTWAEIDLDALEYNYNTIRDYVGRDVKFLAVVKADAYGHGAIQVAKVMQDLGADYLAVSSIDEAMELRDGGITMPVLILGHTPMDQVPKLIDAGITQAITCDAKAKEYSDIAQKCGGKLKVHIKIDTGMSRLGYLVDPTHFENAVEDICSAINMPYLDVEGLFSHFAVSDEVDEKSKEYTLAQLDLFDRVVGAVTDKLGRKLDIVHIANSGGTAQYPQSYHDMVRPGILLYGYTALAKKLGLKPVMSLKSIINTIKVYPEGTPIGYGGTYVTDKTTRVGVIPYGYADGFMRCLSGKCKVITTGGAVNQIGRICMDMSMIDLSEVQDVVVYSEVEIFGNQSDIDELAKLAGTISYELTCSVSKRVPRKYLRDKTVIYQELMLRG